MVIQNITLKNGKYTSSGNSYDPGGGSILVNYGVTAKLYNIIFDSNIDESNASDQYSARDMAGAVMAYGSSDVSIVSCAFTNNKSVASNSVAGAGAVNIGSGVIDRSMFYGNESIGKNGAWGAAYSVQGTGADVTNSVFYNNTATAENSGGAIVIRYHSLYYTQDNQYNIFANNTVANNTANSGSSYENVVPGLFYYSWVDPSYDSHSLYMFNNIFYGKNSNDENAPLVQLSLIHI